MIVSDTSVVLNLCLLAQEELLQVLFGVTYAPTAVNEEFLRLAGVDSRFRSLVFPSFIVIRNVAEIHLHLQNPRLHKGEIEALSLAKEMGVSRVLIDERAGRAAAAALGLHPIGLLGILVEAKRREFISELAPLLDKLQTEGRFWFTPALRLEVLRLSEETS